MPYSGSQKRACEANRRRALRAGYEPAWNCDDKKKRKRKSRSRSKKRMIGGRAVYVKGKRRGKVHKGPRGGRYVIRSGKKVYF